MSNFIKLSTKFRNLRSDQRGNFAIMTALGATMVVAAMGLAINTGQLYNVRSSMAQALDSALTSTTRDITTGVIEEKDAEQSIRNFLAANGDAGLSASDKLVIGELDIDRTARTISASIHSDVTLAFPIFGMANTRRVAVEATSSFTDRPVEVAMMLDVTGSMNERGSPNKDGRYQTKLDNLKEAATKAINELLDRNRDDNNPRVKVALIPYSQGVNAGELAEAIYIEDKKARIGNDPIGLNDPNTALVRLTRSIQTELRSEIKDNCTTERKTKSLKIDLSDDSPEVAMVNRAVKLDTTNYVGSKPQAAEKCPLTSPVVPLTANRKDLLEAVGAFTGAGGTGGHIGIQWTRYLLSPKWSGFLKSRGFKDAAPAPVQASRTGVRKVAILMTDGQFNQDYIAGNKSAEYARAHCAAMKDGIEVFTIGFMLNDKDAKATMAACASKDEKGGVKHYYDAQNAAELNDAFEAITANLEIVRLTH